jgi:hypothetical protein
MINRAHHGPIQTPLGVRLPMRGLVGGRAVGEARVVHFENVAESDEFPAGRELARQAGYRTTLSVPPSARSRSVVPRSGRSSRIRSLCCKPSPTKPSSPSRTYGSSRSCSRKIRRDPPCDQPITNRSASGLRRYCGECAAALPGVVGGGAPPQTRATKGWRTEKIDRHRKRIGGPPMLLGAR